MHSDTTGAYSTAARVLHWISALLFIAALAIGLYIGTLEFRSDRDDYARFADVIHWHKTLGVLVFALAFVRLYHRVNRPAPSLGPGFPRWMRVASRVSHVSLYGCMLLLGASGLVGSDIGNYPVRMFEMWPLPQFPGENRPLADLVLRSHTWLGNLALALVAVHIAASLYHHFALRDDVLNRMLIGRRH